MGGDLFSPFLAMIIVAAFMVSTLVQRERVCKFVTESGDNVDEWSFLLP